METQVERLVAGLRAAFGGELIGAYLHGSAVLGGLRPRSDIDVIAVVTRRMTPEQKRRVIAVSLELSGKPRPIELDVVVQSEIKPWRHPPRTDFHYFELRRPDFEAGELEPWGSQANQELASVITMTLAGDTVLFGPPPAEVFDPIPRADYVDAILGDTKTVDEYLGWDTRNVVLTLPRIWSAIATDGVHSKDSAAAWALQRLPEEHRPVLERARAIYRGETEEAPWDLPQVRAYADFVVAEIERSHDRPRRQLAALAEIHELLERLGIEYWLFGGWAVDFYAGSITRLHDDIDIAVWLEDHDRIAGLIARDGWKHAPEEDEDGGTGYERDAVRLELTFLVRGDHGTAYIPLRERRAWWPNDALGPDVAELDGVRVHIVGLEGLRPGKSHPRDDEVDAAKDRADFETLSRRAPTWRESS